MMLRRAFLRMTVSAAVAGAVALESLRSPVHAFVPAVDLPEAHREEQVVSPMLSALRKWNEDRVLAVAQGRESDFWEGPQMAPGYVHTVSRRAPVGGFVRASADMLVEAGLPA